MGIVRFVPCFPGSLAAEDIECILWYSAVCTILHGTALTGRDYYKVLVCSVISYLQR